MHFRTCLAGLLLLVLASPLQAQNLLDNPDFDSNLHHWTGPAGAATWHSSDLDDAPDSGSARLVNDQAGSETETVALVQCFPVTPGEYQYGGHALIPQGQAASGSVVVRILGYGASTDCSGGTFLISGRLASETGAWSPMAGEITISEDQLSGPAGSIEFEFAIRKTEAGGEFVAFVDAARFGRSPRIFTDRFASP